MARSRNLKPSLFKNEILGTEDPLYTILFESLWCHADREGRLEDRPMRIKAETFPYRESINMDSMLDWLANNKFILRYTADGEKYIQIINFKKHQNPHIKENNSTIPAPFLHGAGSGISGTGHADSLNPLTDSLNPLNTLSGKPDPAPPKKKNGQQHATAEALEVLRFLNAKTGKNFRGLDGNGKPTAALRAIIDRLKTGVTAQDCKTMIARKHRDWSGDDKMRAYLRPSTLFRASNFENYLGECVAKQEGK